MSSNNMFALSEDEVSYLPDQKIFENFFPRKSQNEILNKEEKNPFSLVSKRDTG